MKPELLDVVELLVDLPESAIQAGELGTIVETYDNHAYEVEFADAEGATLALQALEPDQFVVVWKNSTQAWVPLAERIAALLQTLPEDRQQQVLNFARSLHKTPA
jgi:phage terminase Nu1 subunit (DNA packaging protein)